MVTILVCLVVGVISYYATCLFNAGLFALGRLLWDMVIGRP